MRVAIMQPYFFPYLGYFRLFAAADAFVILDNVQFPRRGWVHRNRFVTQSDEIDWLTLALTKTDQDATIAEQSLRDDAHSALDNALRRFPLLEKNKDIDTPMVESFLNAKGRLVPYLERQLATTCEWLGLSTPMVRASTLDIDPELSGAARLIEIAQTLGATHYVNAPGGRTLYDPQPFRESGITLQFLDDYTGSPLSVLHRALSEPQAVLSEEIQLPVVQNA